MGEEGGGSSRQASVTRARLATRRRGGDKEKEDFLKGDERGNFSRDSSGKAVKSRKKGYFKKGRLTV